MSEKLEEMSAGYVGMGQHSQTPWAAKINDGYPEVVDAKGEFVGGTFNENYKDGPNAARIVACVNACEGVDAEDLTHGCYQKLVDKHVEVCFAKQDAEAKRDELLAALREMVAIAELTVGWMPQQPNADGPLIKARAAIAKAEGVKL